MYLRAPCDQGNSVDGSLNDQNIWIIHEYMLGPWALSCAGGCTSGKHDDHNPVLMTPKSSITASLPTPTPTPSNAAKRRLAILPRPVPTPQLLANSPPALHLLSTLSPFLPRWKLEQHLCWSRPLIGLTPHSSPYTLLRSRGHSPVKHTTILAPSCHRGRHRSDPASVAAILATFEPRHPRRHIHHRYPNNSSSD